MKSAGGIATPPNAVGWGLLALCTACGSSGAPSATLTFTAINPWDSGADAGCTIGASSTRVGCASAYPVTGDPFACAGFDDARSGSTDICKVVCNSGLVCSIAGLSDGTNAVDCTANCASPEH